MLAGHLDLDPVGEVDVLQLGEERRRGSAKQEGRCKVNAFECLTLDSFFECFDVDDDVGIFRHEANINAKRPRSRAHHFTQRKKEAR